MEQLSFLPTTRQKSRLNRRLSALRDRVDSVGTHYSNSVAHGKLRDLSDLVPRFTRVPTQVEKMVSSERFNKRPTVAKDTLYLNRLTSGSGRIRPVCQISRGHQFISHENIVTEIEEALHTLRIDHEDVTVDVEYSAHGAKMSLVLTLPSFYDLDPVAMEPLKLQIVLHNCLSQGGLRLLARWRQEGTGVIFPVGVSKLNASLAHRVPARKENILSIISKAIELASRDQQNIDNWITKRLDATRLSNWAGNSVRRMWGNKFSSQLKLELGRGDMRVSDVLVALSKNCVDVKDCLDQCDRIVEASVLMRSLLK